ncbi:hypothetical protein AAIH46_09180 [Rhizobium sp. 0TCS1.26]|uniref:hypothetical protein n=1 Tax=Rhizobium sp. 0TCS1.26 TaxID=3142623 RepID=UPI003D282530
MLHGVTYTAVALLLLTYVGNVICRLIFKITGLTAATAQLPAPDYRAGRVIGILERLILSAGILLHSWEILAAVIALKTVARFQKMDQREFAEYFLVGSMFSILWTLTVTGVWSAYDQHFGVDLRHMLFKLPDAQATR